MGTDKEQGEGGSQTYEKTKKVKDGKRQRRTTHLGDPKGTKKVLKLLKRQSTAQSRTPG